MKSKTILGILFLGSIFLIHPTYAQTGLIPRSVLFEAEKEEYRLELSPDGERLFYQKRSVQEATLFYRNINLPGREQSIPFDGALLDWQLCHNGGILAQVSKGKPQLIYLDHELENQQALALFPFQQINFQATSPRYPDEVLASVITKNDSLSGLYRINIVSGKWKKTAPLPPYQNLYFDQELRPKAARHPNDLGGFSIYRHDGKEWVETKRYPFDVTQFIGGFQDVVSVSADGSTMYITDNLLTDKTVLLAINTKSGKEQLLKSDGKVDLLPFGAMVGPNGIPQMILGVFGEARRHFLRLSAEVDFNYANQLLSGQASFMQSSANGRKWLIRKINGGPVTYYLFDRDSRKMTRLFNDLTELNDYPAAQRNSHSLLTRDGLELPVQVYLPPGADANGDGIPERPLPTILYVHGGPWVGVVHWNQWFHNRNFQLLANRGYAVINTEFRGSTGLGKAFVEAANQQWGEKMLYDKLDIAQWAVDMGIAKEDKLGIWGWSYGGYATAAALAFSPETFACGIAMYGPMDMDAFARIPFTDNPLWHTRVGDPNTPEGTALLKRHSPHHHVDSIQSPILLTTGSKDDRIPQKQMDDFAAALEQAGKSPIYFYYPEEGHDYRQPGSWISFWGIAEQFLHQHLGGQYEPVGRDLKKGEFEVIYGKEYIDALD